MDSHEGAQWQHEGPEQHEHDCGHKERGPRPAALQLTQPGACTTGPRLRGTSALADASAQRFRDELGASISLFLHICILPRQEAKSKGGASQRLSNHFATISKAPTPTV